MQVQGHSWDRISSLPEEVIEKILTLLPIRDALRTSILSKKWMYCWTGIPKLVFDEKLMNVSSETNGDKLVIAIFHVLLLHKGPLSELGIIISDTKISNQIDQIILHISRSKDIKKFILEITSIDEYYKLPCLFFSWQGLKDLSLKHCEIKLPLMFSGFRLLKRLVFYEVKISAIMFKRFISGCPLLEELTLMNNQIHPLRFHACAFIRLFEHLPFVQNLKISQLLILDTTPDDMPPKLPSTTWLRMVVLKVCFVHVWYVLCVMNSSPNLEKMKVELCRNHDRCLKNTIKKLRSIQDYSDIKLDHIKELEITSFRDCGSWMEFLKLIVAKSPVLKKAKLELDASVSVDEENKMLRDLIRMPFARPSLVGEIIIQRPKV